jgi:hypothetical protein
VSTAFLELARGFVGSLTAGQHSLIEYLVPNNNEASPPLADLLFCDAITYELVKSHKRAKNLIPYRLISTECLEQMKVMMSKVSNLTT